MYTSYSLQEVYTSTSKSDTDPVLFGYATAPRVNHPVYGIDSETVSETQALACAKNRTLQSFDGVFYSCLSFCLLFLFFIRSLDFFAR